MSHLKNSPVENPISIDVILGVLKKHSKGLYQAVRNCRRISRFRLQKVRGSVSHYFTLKPLKSIALETLIVSILIIWIPASVMGKSHLKQRAGKERKIIIPHEKLLIAGTLAKPVEKEANPLVIMISGSGPQDRDETLYGFKVFGTLAHELSEEGISSFRYDDRGVGKSTGDFAGSTIDDLTGDVEAIIDYFQSLGVRNFILLGHSQGGIIAGKVAAQNRSVKGVVLMASAGVPMADIVLAQLRRHYADSEIDQSLIDAELDAHKLLMRSIEQENVTNVVLENLEARILGVHVAASDKVKKDMFKSAKDLAEHYEIAYSSPSLASFLFYDPIDDLRILHVPVLGLYGGKDVQATIEQNKGRMEGALIEAGVNYEATTFEKANHLFQESRSGSWEEYKKLDKAFVDGFSNSISTWIKDHFR